MCSLKYMYVKKRANCVLEIIPETVLETIAPWLDMQPDVLEYSKLKERIMFSLTAQQRVDRLISFPAHLEQQHDVTPSQVWHEINSLMTLPNRKEINCAHELWRRCLHPAVRQPHHLPWLTLWKTSWTKPTSTLQS